MTTADNDGSDVLTIAAPVRPAWMIFVDNGDGTGNLTGTPRGSDVGNHPVTLRTRDGVVTADQSFTVTVTAAAEGPVIMILGNNPFGILQNGNFATVDPGATASDPQDGDLTHLIMVDTSQLDTRVPGAYVVT